MSISLDAITTLGLNVIDRKITVNNEPYKGTDAMWDAIPTNVWNITYDYGKATVEHFDTSTGQPTENVEYDNISDIPYSSAFDMTEDPWDPYAT